MAQQLKHPKIRAKLKDKWWLVECTITILMFFTLFFSGLGFFFTWCASGRPPDAIGPRPGRMSSPSRGGAIGRLPGARGYSDTPPLSPCVQHHLRFPDDLRAVGGVALQRV